MKIHPRVHVLRKYKYMDRKEFFQQAFNITVGKGLQLLEETKVGKALDSLVDDKAKLVRPPGAPSSDHDFLERCTGCDACMAACPVNVIMIKDLERRDPVIYPENPCIHCPGYPCIASCPTGALSKILV